jgi:hypothetical protein
MFYAIAPFEFHSELLVVDVETEGTITSGTMVCDTSSHVLRDSYLKYFCRSVTGVGAGNAGTVHLLLAQLSFMNQNSCAPFFTIYMIFLPDRTLWSALEFESPLSGLL